MYNFTQTLESGSESPPTLFFFFKIVLIIFILLDFKNFSISLLISAMKKESMLQPW